MSEYRGLQSRVLHALTRRDFLQYTGAGALAAALAPSAAAGPAGGAPPNVLFILADDLGWRDLGCYGSTFYETPHLDRLARAGMRFTDAYASCPVCSPTRVSVMTGKYPARLNTTDWFGAPQPDTAHRHWTRDKPLLPAPYVDHVLLEETTIAEALGETGYRTFFAGKWHLGGEGHYPEDQGFARNAGGHDKGSPPGGYFAPYGNPKLDDGPEGEYLPLRLARETSAFIQQDSDAPFLAFLSLYSVHTPLQARRARISYYRRKARALHDERTMWGEEGDRRVRPVQDHAVYAAMVEAMDEAVGMVLDAIDAAGVADNTLVIFTSDNGGLSTSEGHPTSNRPLRAGKGWLYEGGIRVPLILRGPGVQAGGVCRVPVTSTDFFPTLLSLAGMPPQPVQHPDGIDLTPVLSGAPTLKRDALFWHYPHYGNQGGSPGAAIRMGDWKLIEFFEDGRVELYNLREDIGEQHDLSTSHPEKVAELRARLKTWQQAVDARFPIPNPAAAAQPST